jgi:hypothetical protein
MIWARSSWFSIIRVNHLRKMMARSLAVFLAQSFWARSAASMACLVSARPMKGMEPITLSFTGLVTSIDLAAPSHLPST